MNETIYYVTRANSKKEFIRTDNKELSKFIEEAQKHYRLKCDSIIPSVDINYPFDKNCFILYLLSHNFYTINNEINKRIDLIRNYLSLCVVTDNYFKMPVFSTFVRFILGINELKFITIYITDNDSKDIDLISNPNKELLKQNLSIYYKNREKIKIDKEYIFNDEITFILFLIQEIINSGTKIRKCINCNRLFINNNKTTNSRYCDYTSPQDKNKSCFKYRSTASYSEVRKNTPIFALHSTIADLLKKRKERAMFNSYKDYPQMEDENVIQCNNSIKEFNKWYKSNMKKYKADDLTDEEFIKLLKEKHNMYKEE